jgi:hypothetical protein
VIDYVSPGSEKKLAKVKNEHQITAGKNTGAHTYIAAIRKSRSLFWMLLRERHMFTNAQAPAASINVHRSVGWIRDVGTTVEKRDRARGDYGTSISPGGTTRSLTTCVHV